MAIALQEVLERAGGISDPAAGVPLNAAAWGYKARKSSVHQAETWNRILADHPQYSPEVCGFKVGAAEKKVNGYFPLVWVRA